jgi:hypothetical protein
MRKFNPPLGAFRKSSSGWILNGRSTAFALLFTIPALSCVSSGEAAGTGGAASVPAGFTVHTHHPTLYVVALAFDAPTASAISIETARRLQQDIAPAGALPQIDLFYNDSAFQQSTYHNATVGCYSTEWRRQSRPDQPQPWIIPEPSWQLADFINQCQTDPEDTVGVIVVSAVENDTGSFNYFSFISTYTQLYADAMVITCEPRLSSEYTMFRDGQKGEDRSSASGTVAIVKTEPGYAYSVAQQTVQTMPAGTAISSYEMHRIGYGKEAQRHLYFQYVTP